MADAADQAQAMTETHMAAALQQRQAAQAQQPLSDGVCRACGERIAPARLAALPTARLCITCAT